MTRSQSTYININKIEVMSDILTSGRKLLLALKWKISRPPTHPWISLRYIGTRKPQFSVILLYSPVAFFPHFLGHMNKIFR